MNTPSPKVLPKMVAGRSLAYLGLQPWEHRHETVEEGTGSPDHRCSPSTGALANTVGS